MAEDRDGQSRRQRHSLCADMPKQMVWAWQKEDHGDLTRPAGHMWWHARIGSLSVVK
jgi:hypothetical protein